jgi:ATP-dependent Zn protease
MVPVVAVAVMVGCGGGGQTTTIDQTPTVDQTPTYDQFVQQVQHNPSSIDSVTFDQGSNSITVKETDGKSYSTDYPTSDSAVSQLVKLLSKKGINVEGAG